MIKEIRSRDNRIYKECRKLSQKKYRDQQGLYLIEGYNLIGEAPASEMMYAGLSGENIYIMEAELFDKIAQTETSQGIIAVMKRRIYDRQAVKRLCGPGKNLAVLDRLQDPGNIGTIIRTAEGAGYAAVVCLRGTGDVYAPKTIRAAAGSVFRIPIIKVEDNRELCGLVRDLGKRLAVTCLDTDNYYFDTDLSSDTALVIGNEGRGVSRELIETADVRVKIPMEGKLESLNASVAAGILMYEAQRKR